MIKPKEITVETMDGETRTYIISRLPAMQAREIVAQYPTSALPKIGNYKVNEEMVLKMMAFVSAITSEGTQIALTTRSLIDNHVPDWETLAKIEMEMVSYNTSFFHNGKISGFLDSISVKAQASITKILTDLLAPSSQKDEQP